MKSEVVEQARVTIRSAARDPVVAAVRQLLTHDLERVKTSLVDAQPEHVATLQGEAQAYRKYLKSLFDLPSA